ncbi:MAG: hypothetical protein JEZ00_17125 [Anaerolineaceae bacterium]|nr:hypothetical protein [Anaerolineaceae bacterium]
MRITKDRLISLAKNFALEETYRDKQIACIFLTGSSMGDQFLLNNTTDIDLVIIHRSKTKIERKTIRINNQIHYDCWTYPIRIFQDAKTLRTDTWIGSSFSDETLLLYDEGHWFNFQQAAIFSKYFEPETRYQRCKPLLNKARTDWLQLDSLDEKFKLEHVFQYFKILENIGYIISGLINFPLPLRRFALQLPQYAAELGKPGLAAGLFDLYCPLDWDDFQWESWIEKWQIFYKQISSLDDCPAAFQSFRMDYYLQPMLLFRDEMPEAALWISLKTLLEGTAYLKRKRVKSEVDVKRLLAEVNLGQVHFPARLDQLDAYLDALELAVEDWENSNGIIK